MAVNYSVTLKTNRLQLVADLIAGKVQAASTGSATAGSIVIQDAASVVLATIALPTTPFVTATGPERLLLQGVPLSDSSADATGTASKAEIRNNGGTAIVTGLTVGSPSGFDINLTSTSITVGQTVTVTSGTITHG